MGMGNWYLAMKSKAHLDRMSLTMDNILSCCCASRLVGRWSSSRSWAAIVLGEGGLSSWCGPSNSSRLEGFRWVWYLTGSLRRSNRGLVLGDSTGCSTKLRADAGSVSVMEWSRWARLDDSQLPCSVGKA